MAYGIESWGGAYDVIVSYLLAIIIILVVNTFMYTVYSPLYYMYNMPLHYM